ncbi:MAG TPA: PHP domain-containing protein [Actinomycetota bacterium]|nr:PHP domain-containing protein [Actinomycetota bacterium]
MSLTNKQLAELLAIQAETAKGHLQRAFRRASRKAFTWPEEASVLAEKGISLQELEGVGPFLARQLHEWLDDPPDAPEPDETRRDFLTNIEAQEELDRNPEYRDALGDLQMHTTWSDGYASLSETVEAAKEAGHQYISITDHSKGLKIAGGIDEAELSKQGRAIKRLNSQLEKEGARLTVLRSIEMNITPAGEGDMETEALEELDIVLASFHSSLRKKEDQTERYIAAIRNPQVQVLGHPRGRIYNFRLGLTADWEKVFAVAGDSGKALEIDCFPDRQDLNVELLKLAREAGVMISIGTDAHHPSQFGFLDLGLAAASKAGIDRSKILNFMPVEKLLEWVSEVRRDAGSPR